MKAALGVAHIGAGSIGVLRAQGAAKTEGLQLRVIADVRADAAKKLADAHRCDFTTSWQDAVRRPDVDLVVISTPPSLHAEMAIAAARAGKHILVEKPIAHTLEDAQKMCEEAEKNGVLFKTGFNHRYFPAMAFAKQLIDSGRIGEVIRVHAYAGHPGGKEFGPNWVTDGAITGGGSLVDNGIHILDLTRFFMGSDLKTGKGYVANLIWPFEKAEDNSFALFHSDTGAIAYVQASWTEHRGYYFFVEAVCSRGYVKASYPPMLAEWGETPAPGIRAKRRYEVFPMFQVKERVFSWRWTIVSSFVAEMSAFVHGIRTGTAVEPTGRDGLKAMQMAHAIYRSSKEGQEVAI